MSLRVKSRPKTKPKTVLRGEFPTFLNLTNICKDTEDVCIENTFPQNPLAIINKIIKINEQ